MMEVYRSRPGDASVCCENPCWTVAVRPGVYLICFQWEDGRVA